MKKGFYSTIAFNNIVKNRRFYLPRILTETGLMGCFYIIMTLALDERLSKVKGGEYLPTFMALGTIVLGLLALILMLYSNSFLMKQRKRELGLYNILGMEKRHVGKVFLYESLYSSITSLVLGLSLGMLFYKLCSLLICKLLGVKSVLGFYFISPKTLIPTALFFVITDILTYAINRIRIGHLKPVELLQSSHTGEKEPKVKWLLLVVGILCLAAGYYIALTTESPLKAVLLFFVAVILVIIGTYCLFITGSIWVLKLLKKNKKYYYSPRHMPAVSGLLYRMKQNAVGLASIAILATGLLVMISTTISLYAGMEQTMVNNYPQDMYINVGYETENADEVAVPCDDLEKLVKDSAGKYGLEVTFFQEQRFLDVAFLLRDGKLITDRSALDSATLSGLSCFTVITAKDYTAMTGKVMDLDSDELAVCYISMKAHTLKDSVSFADRSFRVTKELETFPVDSRFATSVDCCGIVVSDDSVLQELYLFQKKSYGDSASEYTNRLAVSFSDREKACENGEKLDRDLSATIEKYVESQPNHSGPWYMSFDSVWKTRDNMFGMYGTLLFLGLLLGLVFLFATALIIYYKQISEGYEDRDRFQIMEKIGMSNGEVRKTIRRQIVLVFFLPLLVAGVHIAVAFPMLTKLLHVLLLSSTWLFAGCTVAVFLLFSLIYVCIYALTARTYYKIVH